MRNVVLLHALHRVLAAPRSCCMLDARALRLQAARELFNLQGDSVDLTFGVVTILTGIVATIVGGVCLDIVGSSLKNAMLLCGERTWPTTDAAWRCLQQGPWSGPF